MTTYTVEMQNGKPVYYLLNAGHKLTVTKGEYENYLRARAYINELKGG
jgi:hypothetical protein